MTRKIAVIGDGPWPCAIASLIKRNKRAKRKSEVHLWSFSQPHFDLENIIVNKDIDAVMKDAEATFFVVNTKYLPETIARIDQEIITKSTKVISASKGFVDLGLSSQFIKDKLKLKKRQIAALSGPNLAREVYECQFSSTVVASENSKLVNMIINLLTQDNFTAFPSKDIVSLELLGALKNAYVIIHGIGTSVIKQNPTKYGMNTNALLYSLCTSEMAYVAQQLRGIFSSDEKNEFDSLMLGLPGIGDFDVTCSGGRNHKVGLDLGRNVSLNQALSTQKNQLPEGPETIRKLHGIIQKYEIEAPLLEEAYSMLYESQNIDSTIKNLLERKAECYFKK